MKALAGDDVSTTMASEMTGVSADQKNISATPDKRRGLPKVRSGLNLGANYKEAQEGQIHQKEMQFK